MRSLINTILNKQNITEEGLQQLADYYSIMLLYKSNKKTANNNKIADDFVKVLRKLSNLNP